MLDPTTDDRPWHLVYPDEQLAQRCRASDALRRLGEALVGRRLTNDTLADITAWADATATATADAPTLHRPDDYQRRRYTDPGPENGDRLVSFIDRPVSGPANPASHNMVIWRDGNGARAVVRLGRLEEASPGRAHGGVTAALFDDVMGYVMSVAATAAYTGELTVRYLAPLPLWDPVHFTAAVAERAARVWTLRAEAHVGEPGGELAATATAKFVIVPPERFGLTP